MTLEQWDHVESGLKEIAGTLSDSPFIAQSLIACGHGMPPNSTPEEVAHMCACIINEEVES
jgi:uroporphyrinogen-III decarboxylase